MKKNMIAVLGAVAGLACAAGTVSAATVTVNGSTTVLPAMQLVSEGFMKANPDVTVTISGTGSGNGIKALRDNMTDIAMSSRDLKSKEAKDFEAHNIKTVRITVAHDAIIPVVNTKNAVKGLTMEQLKDVFAGKIKSWDQLGGAKAPIVVVGRDSSSGTFETFQELVMGKTRVSPRALIQASSGGVVQAISQNPNAIGYIGVGYMDAQTHALTINNVKPGMESAKDKTWPISRDLYLFTAGEPAGDAKKLIDFMLSDEGQKDVQKSGFVPVK
ncbi:PstS family phosphate ABC transporter substrate-binding protein [Sutterella sp.]|uniref:PstS family phosphate ABC transporter substrate-binding protein n=1 Tax=Sutterella sp. TaxID=1981025 RepID=UPI0026E03D29|nr:PstS family phosphate ABC transporter substrate-binding protein [Sutterella sp.]MDO5530544.1 PstS family phosphate ABC transporter substrate-binding protein [Sutterella sp.]